MFEKKINELYKDNTKERDRILSNVDWDYWLNEEGLPTWENNFSTPLVKDVNNAAASLFKNIIPDNFKETFEGWVSQQQELLLNAIYDSYDESKINDKILDYLSDDLNIKDEDQYNMQIRYSWLLVELKYKNQKVVELASIFVGKIGRIFYIRNIYKEWYSFDPIGARKRFEEVKSTYHPMCAKLVEADMNSKERIE